MHIIVKAEKVVSPNGKAWKILAYRFLQYHKPSPRHSPGKFCIIIPVDWEKYASFPPPIIYAIVISPYSFTVNRSIAKGIIDGNE